MYICIDFVLVRWHVLKKFWARNKSNLSGDESKGSFDPQKGPLQGTRILDLSRYILNYLPLSEMDIGI